MKSILIYLTTAIITFISPIKGILLTLIMFIILDTITGIYVSIKLGGIKKYKSTKLFNIVVKSFFYLSTVMMAFLLDKFVFEGSLFGTAFLLSKAMAVVWIYIEVKSLDENQQKLTKKSLWVVVKELIDRLKGIKKDLGELGIEEDKKSIE